MSEDEFWRLYFGDELSDSDFEGFSEYIWLFLHDMINNNCANGLD